MFRVLSLTKHGSHHPSLRLAFGLAVSDGKLIRRFAVTISFGVIAVVGTASLISCGLGISHVQSEITGRTSMNLIDLGIAMAAAAGSFAMTRKQLSNSIAGVEIAVALVPSPSASVALASHSAPLASNEANFYCCGCPSCSV
ncbi:DUF389 domain-containing protein [Synechococcus sp. MU1648]|uniref:DUF389 domain-containing protein n=1 Tax=Synechococcus sp. MU1648 TaxID=2508351 RepID=UPI002026C91F